MEVYSEVEESSLGMRKTLQHYFRNLNAEFKLHAIHDGDRFDVNAKNAQERRVAELDNLYSNLTINTYIEYRMAQQLRKLEQENPTLVSVRNLYENAVVIMGLL